MNEPLRVLDLFSGIGGFSLGGLGDAPVCRSNDQGSVDAHFRVRPIAPQDIANCFNRFGSLRLSYWNNPRAFSSMAEVYG